MNHLKRFNLNDKQIKDITKTDLVEKILSEYIGKRVMALEIKELGISINDNADVIVNNELIKRFKLI